MDKLAALDSRLREKYADRFPSDIPPVDDIPADVYHRIRLHDVNKTITTRSYNCPRKYHDMWRTLLSQHLAADCMRPSSSTFASPSFIVPKANPTVLPRWVNNYRKINENTIPDNHPLLCVDDILADCAKGKIWGKMDMTNSFFQTRVHPDDIHLTAVTTPFGMYKWTVMPMGGRNAPATHQHRMCSALRHLIGDICHVYLDDIIIWSQTIEEHIVNMSKVLDTLHAANLYCSPKKTSLFCDSVDFLGHTISAAGIQADASKAQRILDWPVLKCTTDIHTFLGLVRCLVQFLPRLADFMAVLTPLTMKATDAIWPGWSGSHQSAFETIKGLVTSRDCLTMIDHVNPGKNRIFVTCDASDFGTGAVLSFGPTWEMARPVAFESAQLNSAERNYPMHEKELLAIVRALNKWRCDLLGTPFVVRSDHRTLENFTQQKGLSQWQARWQEFLADYDFRIKYVPGEDNCAADALPAAPLAPLCSCLSCFSPWCLSGCFSIVCLCRPEVLGFHPCWLH